ncbi:MAG: DUF3096 domain-containing protein [Nanoarchaeota archaeon]
MVLISLVLSAILAILAGIVVLAWPKSLNIAVGLWLLISGILQLIAQY